MSFTFKFLSYTLLVALQPRNTQPLTASIEETATSQLQAGPNRRSVDTGCQPNRFWLDKLSNAMDIEEKSGKEFVGWTWFLNIALPQHAFLSDKSPQFRSKLLHQAIDLGEIEIYKVPNPYKPFPTTAIRLKTPTKK